MTFNYHNLRDGMILHTRDLRPGLTYGSIIRRVIGSWGNHDALIRQVDGVWMACDVRPHRARYTDLIEYQDQVNLGKCSVMIFSPFDHIPEEAGAYAGQWWGTHVLGHVYDYRGVLSILAKFIFRRVSDRVSDWKWAWWCTESGSDAYVKGAGIDLWSNEHPTPRTTERRAGMHPISGTGLETLRDVTRECVGV